VRFEYEWHDHAWQWYRAYGNEMWEFDATGLMARRYASINDASIRADERRVHVPPQTTGSTEVSR
jgi:nuclear transport factor 2 (NTF2) superfamily protein